MSYNYYFPGKIGFVIKIKSNNLIKLALCKRRADQLDFKYGHDSHAYILPTPIYCQNFVVDSQTREDITLCNMPHPDMFYGV